MALTTIQQLEHAMKNIYLDPLIKLIDESSGPIMKAIEKKERPLEGNKFVFAVQYGRNGGLGARGESDMLPESNPRPIMSGRGEQRNLYGRIAFTEKFMKQAKSSKASFVDGITTQMEDLAADAKDYMRRNLMTNHTGMMGKTTAGATSTDSVVMNEGTVMTQFYPGQVVDFFTVDNEAKPTNQTKSADGVRIKDVDYGARKIFFEKNVTIAANSYVSIHDAFNKELTGISEIMTLDNTIYGIDRSKNKWFNARSYDKANAQFDSIFMQEAIDDIFDTLGTKPDFIAMNSATRRAYIEEQKAFKRNMEYMKIDGGTDFASFDKIPISVEKYMKDGEIYILSTNDLEMGQLADWGWMDEDGAILRAVSDHAAYEATLTKYCELLCRRPSSQAAIRKVKITA